MLDDRQDDKEARRGRQIRDIGSYTLIPMMMLVGPVLGFLIGKWVEKQWGYAPWPSTGGALFGLAAAVRQIYLILSQQNRNRKDERR